MRTLRGRVSGVANHAPGSGAVFRKSLGAAALLIWASVAWVAPAAAQNALPVFANSTETRSFRETPPDLLETRARPVGAPVVATDADGHTLTYTLQGTHASAFAIDGTTGQISTKTGRSYRITDRTRHSVTVKATDSEGGEATVPVTIVVIELVAPEVRGRPEVSGARRSGRWSYRTTIRVALTFSEAVDVDTSGGRPTVVVRLGGFTSRVRTARYLSGSGTTELVFGYTLARHDGRHSTIHVQQNSLMLSGATIRSAASGLPADLRHLRKTARGIKRSSAGATARLWAVPTSHDGTTAFTMRLNFSGTPTGLSPATDAASVLLLTGGARDQRAAGARRHEFVLGGDGHAGRRGRRGDTTPGAALLGDERSLHRRPAASHSGRGERAGAGDHRVLLPVAVGAQRVEALLVAFRVQPRAAEIQLPHGA